MKDVIASDFESWREAARGLLDEQTPPAEVSWRAADGSPSLFAAPYQPPVARSTSFKIPRRFVELAEKVACHRSDQKWGLLYSVLWRLTHGERGLLDLPSDEQVYQLLMLEKAIRRDIHKMHAFVRFRIVQQEDGEWYVAWYRPDHHIVRLATPFFRERFAAMRWAVLTPEESAYWDRHELSFGPGLPRSAAPADDELEDAWRAYYRSIFNPARIKLNAMRKEMPVRFWDLLPETAIVNELLREAPRRVETMIARQEGSAASARDHVPARLSLETLREAASSCTGCDLHENATQVVFGEGRVNARLMFVGEQPGDQEDLQGRPFVGPSGQLLDDVLRRVGLDRGELYITNTVKHFSFTDTGSRRLHKKPSARQVIACVPWLDAEIQTVKPHGIVCLGATAAQALLGRDFRLTKQRGVFLPFDRAAWIMATYHPSALLRAPDPDAHAQMMADFEHDIAAAKGRAA